MQNYCFEKNFSIPVQYFRSSAFINRKPIKQTDYEILFSNSIFLHALCVGGIHIL